MVYFPADSSAVKGLNKGPQVVPQQDREAERDLAVSRRG